MEALRPLDHAREQQRRYPGIMINEAVDYNQMVFWLPTTWTTSTKDKWEAEDSEDDD